MDLSMRMIVIPKINARMEQRYQMEVVSDAMKVIYVHNVRHDLRRRKDDEK